MFDDGCVELTSGFCAASVSVADGAFTEKRELISSVAGTAATVLLSGDDASVWGTGGAGTEARMLDI